jgi:hypothetical protein
MKLDRRKEKERLVNKAMEEIHEKGMGEGRGEEYQKRQLEWWKECDKALYVK